MIRKDQETSELGKNDIEYWQRNLKYILDYKTPTSIPATSSLDSIRERNELLHKYHRQANVASFMIHCLEEGIDPDIYELISFNSNEGDTDKDYGREKDEIRLTAYDLIPTRGYYRIIYSKEWSEKVEMYKPKIALWRKKDN